MPTGGSGHEPFILTPDQKQIANDALNAYLCAPPDSQGRSLTDLQKEFDDLRVNVIDNKLKPLLNNYFDGVMSLPAFKREIDSINKQNQLWGFRGIKGQMFFNVLLNVTQTEECDPILKGVLAVPADDMAAAAQLERFRDYVEDAATRFSRTGGDRRAAPRSGSIPFFVSYFWQIQQQDIWPVYYTNSVQVMTDLNLWQETGDISADYLRFKELHQAFVGFFS